MHFTTGGSGFYLRGVGCEAPGTNASSGAATSPPTSGDGELLPLGLVTKLVEISRAFAFATTIYVRAMATPLSPASLRQRLSSPKDTANQTLLAYFASPRKLTTWPSPLRSDTLEETRFLLGPNVPAPLRRLTPSKKEAGVRSTLDRATHGGAAALAAACAWSLNSLKWLIRSLLRKIYQSSSIDTTPLSSDSEMGRGRGGALPNPVLSRWYQPRNPLHRGCFGGAERAYSAWRCGFIGI
jgi:hypothetical protein